MTTSKCIIHRYRLVAIFLKFWLLILDAIPADGGRLSAVARRRLLRDAQDGPGNRVGLDAGDLSATSGASSPAPVPSPAVEGRQALIPAASEQHFPKPDENEDFVTSQNQFTPLVEAAAVKFTPTREIEPVGRTALKVRLERGQV